MGEIGGRGMRGVGERNRKAEKDVIIFYLKLKVNLYNFLKKKLIQLPITICSAILYLTLYQDLDVLKKLFEFQK